MGRSGKEVAIEYVARFKEFVDMGDIPRGPTGKMNIGEVSERTGIPRQSFYKNPAIRTIVDSLDGSATKRTEDVKRESDANQVKRLVDSKARVLERRVSKLEQHNAALVAENAELRRLLKVERQSTARLEHAMLTGRRVAIPDDE